MFNASNALKCQLKVKTQRNFISLRALCYSPYTVLLLTLRTIALSCKCLSEISPSNPIKQLRKANVPPLHPLLGPEERALPYTKIYMTS